MSWAAIGTSVGGAVVGGILSKNNGSSTQNNSTGNTYSSNYSQMTPYPGNSSLYGYLMGQANQLMQTPQPYYPGQTYVGPSSATQAGVNNMMDTAQGYMGNIDQLMGNFANIPGAMNLNNFANATDIQNNPAVQAMMGANATSVNNQLQNNWLPAISNSAQQVNALGSGRAGLAQGTAMGQAVDALASANANVMNNAYSQGLNAQLGAQGQAVQDMSSVRNNMLQGAQSQANLYTQNAWLPSQMMLNAGQTVEDYQGKALQDQINRYNWMFQEPQQRIGMVQNILGTTNALNQGYNTGSGQTTNTGTTYTPGNFLYGAGVGYNVGQGLYNQYIK